MAFRHYGSPPPAPATLWRCPGCGAENAGTLEGGCSTCGAGRDAKKVEIPIPPAVAAELRSVVDLKEPAEEAFAAWFTAHLDATPKEAFMAGIVFALEATSVSSFRASPVLSNLDPATLGTPSLDLQDPRVGKTLAEALRFYCDNQLKFGDLPGQLPETDARALADQLDPPESEIPL